MKNQCFRNKWLFLLAFCLALCPASARAQAISGDLTGTVFDASGAAIANASIVALDDATGVRSAAQTNAEGIYRFTNLPIGRYTITATAPGFTSDELKNVDVTLNTVVTANLTLQLERWAQRLKLAPARSPSTRPPLNCRTRSTPTKSLNCLRLRRVRVCTTWRCWVQAYPRRAESAKVSARRSPGQRPDNNSFFLDGVSNNNYYDPAPLIYVSNEAVGEFTLLQNQFAPEFGGGSGGIFNALVKSGTNQIHGSVYEYLQNRNLNAVNALDAVAGYTSNPRYDNNRLGRDHRRTDRQEQVVLFRELRV